MNGYINIFQGTGGIQTNLLIKELFAKSFSNSILNEMNDSAILNLPKGKLAFTTDSFTVKPLFFNGGDIGKLSICGTVNDLAVSGALPLYLSSSFVIEEGFSLSSLEKIVASMEKEAKKAKVQIVCGDTKVVEKGSLNNLIINTSGIGIVYDGVNLCSSFAKEGDSVIVNGSLGEHELCILTEREGLPFKNQSKSDCASLNSLTEKILKAFPKVHVMRDLTRGGLASALNEIAEISKVSIVIDEAALPIKAETKAACNILGLDPLSLANEGKLCLFIEEKYAKDALKIIKLHPLGKNASIIGTVKKKCEFKVVLKTSIKGERPLNMPSNLNLPRIC